MNEDEDFKGDELINIKLPREQYELLKTMIKREQAYNWLTSTLKSSWLWAIGSGILILLTLYDRFHAGLFGTIK